MKAYFDDGAIVTHSKLFEKLMYDVSNDCMYARFDGCGAISNYTVINEPVYYNDTHMYLKFHIDGENISPLINKEVRMWGRKQEVSFETGKVIVRISTFIGLKENGVFQKIEIEPKKTVDVKIALFMRGALSSELQNIDTHTVKSLSKNNHRFMLAANAEITCCDSNESLQFDLGTIKDKTVFKCVYAFENTMVQQYLHEFDHHYDNITKEIQDIAVPSSANTEMLKALYYSAYFCALQNYKECGEFKGFMAGCNYISPARTYYRDSYYTMLPMYYGNIEKVRAELVTLSRGVREDGSCPSAVKYDFSEFWGRHYDSPSLYCMALYDYVNNTGDWSILSEKVGNRTILETAKASIRYLQSLCDETGLINKEGKSNRLDWEDEVNRYGYVTYDEILFARALYCMSKLVGGEEGQILYDNFVRVKDAINKHLWSDELGYYVNFKNDDYTETNLSIDIVFAVIFNIADENKSLLLLKKFEEILETRNNNEVEDFGVMCVYPLYSGLQAGCNKSARPFDYHNGAEWPYLSALYAYARKMHGMDYTYALSRWFTTMVEKGCFTPVEFHSPYCPAGSTLQAWSGLAAFVMADSDCNFFKNKI